MKTKISFTSVLKNKSLSRPINNSSQHSTESQYRSQRLIDIYHQFQSNPNKPYTLDLNSFRSMAHRSRNSSIGLIRSRNVNQDPQMDLQSWIQNQKIKQNSESQSRYVYNQTSFKNALSSQNQIPVNKKSKSNFKKDYNETQQEYGYYQNQNINQTNDYQTSYMQQSNKVSNKQRKSSINFRSQNQPRYTQQTQLRQDLMIQSSKKSPQQYIALAHMRQKTEYPGIQDQDYKILSQEFEKIKAQKIAQICRQGKKFSNKQKMQQIIQKALQNIHKDIQAMASQIVAQKNQKNVHLPQQTQLNKNKKSQQPSQQMLISGSGQSFKDQISQSNQIMRREQYKNEIRGYISGIQEAKNQGKNSYTYKQKQSQNNFYENTFNNQLYSNQPLFTKAAHDFSQKVQTINKFSQNEAIDSVGYSFSNSNMICEHSFNKQLNTHNNFQAQNAFQKNFVQPPIYQPQNQDEQEQQKISLPYVQQVKSDCGDFPHQNLQVESSEQIQFKRKKLQNLTLDISGKNIKNIQSVHYQPPAEQDQNRYQLTNQRQTHKQELFKNFEKSSNQVSLKGGEKNNQTGSSSQNTLIQAPKFVSKTFNSYLSGQRRFEYGQNMNLKQTQYKQVINSQSKQASTFESSHKIISITPPLSSNSIKQAVKINSINKSLPETQKQCLQARNLSQIQPTKKPEYNHLHSSSKQQSQSSVGRFIRSSKESHEINNQAQRNDPISNSTTRLNDSSALSLNQSITNHSLASITSPKNLHQLKSKQKFNINSPINQASLQQVNQQPLSNSRQSKISQFVCINQKPSHNRSSSYAISSPVQEYMVSETFKQKISNQKSDNKIAQMKYACSQAMQNTGSFDYKKGSNSKNYEFYYKKQQILIKKSTQNESVQNSKLTKNSILQMQPLKLSIPDSNYSQNNFKQVSVKQLQKQSSCKSTGPYHQYPGIQRVAQSHENNDLNLQSQKIKPKQTQKVKQNLANNNYQNISSGRNFLQSLNTKQSIQIDIPSLDTNKQALQSKQSFATETFRPLNVNQSHQSVSKPSLPIQKSTPTNKVSLTKITIKSSSDRNQIGLQKTNLSSDKTHIPSPKVISLTVNHLGQNKVEQIKSFNIAQHLEQKQNVFQRLTIKQGSSTNDSSNQKKMLIPSQMLQSSNFNLESLPKCSNQSANQEKSPLINNPTSLGSYSQLSNINLQQSIKTSQNICGVQISKAHTHADMQSKQNNNTLNQQNRRIQNNYKQGKDWKNESMKFDLNIDNQPNALKQSISTVNKSSLADKKQPLLKLSKNLANSINQSNLHQISSNYSTVNVKKSIGQSIKLKANQPYMMSSKGNSMKKSFKGGVKQSIGNDSDMDFDLQLD